MATQLSIVNSILERLREDTVTTVNENSYSKLIACFVNDAKADMEDINYEWAAYETEIDISILSDGTRLYDITSETNDRSWLLRDSNEDRIPAAYDITSNEVGQLYDAPLKDIHRERALTNNIVDVSNPKVFALKWDSDGGWQIELLWGSNTARDWRMYFYVPQAPLATDGSDDNTELQLSSRPIYLRALAYALMERGEELGEPLGPTWQRSRDAIAAALETDMQVQKKSDEIDITNKESL